jgi:hypothetical protein
VPSTSARSSRRRPKHIESCICRTKKEAVLFMLQHSLQPDLLFAVGLGSMHILREIGGFSLLSSSHIVPTALCPPSPSLSLLRVLQAPSRSSSMSVRSRRRRRWTKPRVDFPTPWLDSTASFPAVDSVSGGARFTRS